MARREPPSTSQLRVALWLQAAELVAALGCIALWPAAGYAAAGFVAIAWFVTMAMLVDLSRPPRDQEPAAVAHEARSVHHDA